MPVPTAARLLSGVVGVLLTVAVLPVGELPLATAAGLKITRVRVTEVTPSSFTVTLASLGSGWKYRLYTSTTKADVFYVNLPKARHRSALSAKQQLTVSRLPYSSSPYWYRVQATKGSSHHTSDIFSVGLRPSKPRSLSATTVAGGAISLSWRGTASDFTVQQASDARFTTDVHTHPVRGGGHQLTPHGLSRGSIYWFRVRALNTGTASGYTTPVRAMAKGTARPLRAMTFNILTLDDDGKRAAGAEKISPWSERRLAAARQINSEAPDVVGVQEGAAWVAARRGPRQVDSLIAALRGKYALARTETPPNQPYYFRTGNYVLYKSSVYAAVGAGGHWDLGEMPGGGHRWAAYQVMRHRTTGTTFLFVSTHLYVVGGAAGDAVRRDETSSLLRQARAYAASHGGLPAVYAGDVNSHEGHPLDGPAVAMRAAATADAQLVAPRRTNLQYNSANQYRRLPPRSGLALDRIYASPGIAVTAWRQVLRLSNGRLLGVIPSDHNPVVADLVLHR